MGDTPTGEGMLRAMKVNEIQQQIGRGEYEVDPHAVADAIIRRLLGSPGRPGPAASSDEPEHPGA